MDGQQNDNKDVLERRERLHKRFQAEAVPWIERRTVVIFKQAEGGAPVPEGTGVLLQVADRHFLVTAAHALKVWREMSLIIPLGDGTGIDIRSSRAELTRDQRDADFALVPLTDPMVERLLAASKDFVRLAEVDVSGDEPAFGIHAVFGYPLELSKVDEGWRISDAIYYPTTITKLPDVDHGLSIVLDIHPEIVDSDGDRSRLPDLHGISGCGIWRLHLKGDDIESWSEERIRLVGIEHTVLPNRWIRGARIRHVIAGVASQFPDLERCVALIGIKLVK